MRDYELMCVLQPELEDADITALVDTLKGVIDDAGGTVDFSGQLVDKKGNVASAEEGWRTRRLAYAIDGNQEAYYAVVRFQVEPTAIDELERVMNISDDVLRHLVTRYEVDEPATAATE